MEKASEKYLERKLVEKIKALGGMAVKLTSQYQRGLPDRLILMPTSATYFVELKSEGKRPTSHQKASHKELQKLGYEVFIIDNKDKLNDFIDRIHTPRLPK